VLNLAGRVSELEMVVQQMLNGARFNSALIVLFAGAITAVFAVGRTLGTARDAGDDTGQASSSNSETAYHSNS
jgi:hypothetical protein